MTSLPNRPNTALLVIDVQNGVVAGAHQRDEVIANITPSSTRRAEEVPVIWVQHSDEMPEGSDSGSTSTSSGARDGAGGPQALRRLLRGHRPRGAARAGRRPPRRRRRPDRRVRPLDAARRLTRGYDTTLVGDAHTTEDLTEWGARPSTRSSPTPTSTGRGKRRRDRRRRRHRRRQLRHWWMTHDRPLFALPSPAARAAAFAGLFGGVALAVSSAKPGASALRR